MARKSRPFSCGGRSSIGLPPLDFMMCLQGSAHELIRPAPLQRGPTTRGAAAGLRVSFRVATRRPRNLVVSSKGGAGRLSALACFPPDEAAGFVSILAFVPEGHLGLGAMGLDLSHRVLRRPRKIPEDVRGGRDRLCGLLPWIRPVRSLCPDMEPSLNAACPAPSPASVRGLASSDLGAGGRSGQAA